MKSLIIFLPSSRAMEKVAKLARYAVKYDTWMKPTTGYTAPEAATEFYAYKWEQIDRWEETCHFARNYDDAISDLANQQALRYKINKDSGFLGDYETYYYKFYRPLCDHFWSVWCDKQNLYKFWNEKVRTK